MNESYRSSGFGTLAGPEPDERFSILIAGDFGGGNSAGIRRPIPVDRDCFDSVLAEIRPRMLFSETMLSFSELDDFHPDNLYRKCDLFRRAEPQVQPIAEPASSHGSDAGLLDRIVDLSSENRPARPEFTGDLRDFIRQVTASQMEPKEDAGEKQRVVREGANRAAMLRRILHHPRFQSLEALWRGVAWLVFGLDTDTNLRIFIIDVPVTELAADAGRARRLLSAGEHRWSAILLDHAFGQTPEDARALELLGGVARSMGAVLLAESAPPSDQVSEEWIALRKSAVATSIGLVLPRFLLRLPYGAATSSVEQFPFEEMRGSVHQEYLWGNPAFACAFLLGQAFLEDGWNMRPGSHRRVENLPLHVYQENGENVLKPCAEILLSEHDAEYLMNNGIMPLASLKDRDEALLVRFQSIADPPTALSGRWNSASRSTAI